MIPPRFGLKIIYQPTFGMEVADCFGRTRRPEATTIGMLLALTVEALANGVVGGGKMLEWGCREKVLKFDPPAC